MAKIMSLFTTIPFGLLLIMGIVYSRLLMNNYLLPAAIANFSYGIYGIGLVLSWWFNRSRVFFMMIVLAISQYALSDLATAIAIPAFSRIIYAAICILLPINIFIFSLIKERGIFNFWGLGRFGIIASQMFYIALAVTSNDDTLLNSFYQEPSLAVDMFVITTIPQPAILVYSAAFILVLRTQLQHYSYMNNTFNAVLVASMLALHLKAAPLAIPIFFGTAGILLIMAVIQDSYSMAYLDELTGLPARRALKEELMKLRGEYTIAMVDIDFFKKFNDTYGHDTGDEVLRLVASVLKKVGGGGKAFRYGGEEFTILFPYTTSADAIPHLEKLRMAVEKTPYAYQKRQMKKTKRKPAVKKLSVTISIGLAERSEKNKETEAVIKAADSALYRAKEKGRNCVSK
ncbi:Response regulator PleD [Sporomusa ovata DSM 2662]|uniref:GGDEF domain-containing protein n=1 Tax=Sporomusa ovata TaxID=2378 RepID=A0A0U1L0C8_9FIRM|nr:GGDEF domain-containing protein [Sporomusa ovata]EQB27276.1 response regulator PleD [Sporomusa ovata DSM 2662]CQR73116.1 hypothetical protein SpAn4DRAFT_2348 [Sporomusa ovata]